MVCPESGACHTRPGIVCPKSGAQYSDPGMVCPESGVQYSDFGMLYLESKAKSGKTQKSLAVSQIIRIFAEKLRITIDYGYSKDD